MRLIDADELKKCVLKWLPQDPCGKEEKEFPFETDICVSMLMEIDEQPTIQLEPHWIPVTEPPKGDFMPYYATCRSKVDDRENWVIEGMYTKYSGWEYTPMVRDDRAEIIAWMPKELPEPYKGVTQ